MCICFSNVFNLPIIWILTRDIEKLDKKIQKLSVPEKYCKGDCSQGRSPKVPCPFCKALLRNSSFTGWRGYSQGSNLSGATFIEIDQRYTHLSNSEVAKDMKIKLEELFREKQGLNKKVQKVPEPIHILSGAGRV